MATDSKLKMRLALEPREVAAVIVACNEMLEDGLETDLERVIAKIDFGRYS